MKPPESHRSERQGFALVVTLSLMVLLAIVAVGLLSLSAVSLRAGSQGAATAEARSNARLALMLAIGELQKEMGPDQRVSASGAIVTDATASHPHWTGVWNSWRAGSATSTADHPDPASEHSTISGAANNGMAPTYEAQRKDHFRSWLVSLDPQEAESVSSPIHVSLSGSSTPAKGATAVELVGEGSLGSEDDKKKDRVSARLLAVNSGTAGSMSSGRYGWWVGDESQKARLMDDSYQAASRTPTMADKLFRQQAPGSTGTTTIKGLESLTDDTQLAGLPSLQTLDLVDGANGRPARNFNSVTPFSYAVLTDVREGGLKRDLSTLLERPIDPDENGDEFMLYKFRTKDQWMGGAENQEAVPIQDLAAYYQLYDSNRKGWQEGVSYTSNLLNHGIQAVSPEYGDTPGYDPAFARQYTTLYRQPVPVKLQFLLSMFAEPIGPGEATPGAPTHLLRVGITPSMTFWNPLNVPLIMNFDDKNPNRFAQLVRTGTFPLTINWKKSNGYESGPLSLTWFSYGDMTDNKAHLLNLYFSGKRPIRFEPGEVKCFSLPFSGETGGIKQGGDQNNTWYIDEFLYKTDKFYEGHEVIAGWEPRSFLFFNRSAPAKKGDSNIVSTGSGKYARSFLAFSAGDQISFEIRADTAQSGDSYRGAPFFFKMIQSNHQCYTKFGGTAQWGRNNYVFNCRNKDSDAFSKNMVTKGFPNGADSITAAARSGSGLIARAKTQEGWPFMQFSLQAPVETNEASNGGLAGGRKFATRPFLHASVLSPPFIDDFTGNSLYNSGWNWSIDEINEVFEAPVQISVGNQGYFGGGYTPENGTTHLVQQEVPVTPPITIAALSHAHLGGFSIADQLNPGEATNQVVTATGQAGLFPHTLQAVGNSYAHPLLAPDKAYDTYQRTFDGSQGSRAVTLADHSYLANKALWDEFFFSSITPQPGAVKVFESSSSPAAGQVAKEFFRDKNPIPLPNRRMVPYKNHLDPSEIDALFTTKQQQEFSGGLADKIAAHLMVEGPFNVNSTSVEAWKTVLSSLKGKPVAYLDKDSALTGGIKFDQATPDGTPVGFSLPNGRPVSGSASEPSAPNQWTNWRELNDTEIEQLATAIVKQVKLRGPFLSLSEFVNRRLDSSDEELSVKGALQAALDDPSVAINAGFRSSARQFSSSEISSMKPAFKKALEGPVAYGSAPYVDQADILRNLAAQLTPRGDTFVIRTYGDSLDAQGDVQARAWCEAVVQRVPDYLDPTDDPELRQADLKSEANKIFGRRLILVSFRWLSPSEV